MRKRIGERTLLFRSEPRVRSAAAIVARNEGEGAYAGLFDTVLEDDKFGEDSFEKAECKMFQTAALLACQKAGLDLKDIHVMLAGDLLNQIITANYAARDLGIPFLGLYGACSTMAESLLLGGVLSDGGYCSPVLCCASSHFSTAERQYRFPLEMGTTAPPTAQRTVTGAGALLLSTQDVPLPVFSHIALTAATIGRVVDLGITDTNNMGAAMAPASVILTPCPRRSKTQQLSGFLALFVAERRSFPNNTLVCCKHQNRRPDKCSFGGIYMAKQGAKPRKKKIRWQPIRKPPEGKITYLRSSNDQAAEIWISVFQMKHKRKIRAFLKCVDEHDDGYHPISYQIERGVRYL